MGFRVLVSGRTISGACRRSASLGSWNSTYTKVRCGEIAINWRVLFLRMGSRDTRI